MRLTNVLGFRLLNTVRSAKVTQFVPKHEPVKESDIKLLEQFLANRPNVLVLTGAGISTESGIPDYRSAGVGLYARSTSRPIQYPEFIKYEAVRKRYWARNYVAWTRFSQFQPNAIHLKLAQMERANKIQAIVTQNVDTLHTKAGSKNVIDLHGNGYSVKCLSCDYRITRHEFQSILNTLNPTMIDHSDCIRPDGDVDVTQTQIEMFTVPACPSCGGNLKPDIVFFGDNVPMPRIMDVTRRVIESDGLLVLGSSLLVFSGYRIVLQTLDCHLPVAIVNIGPTRADDKATLKINAKCGDIIPKLAL